MLLAWFLMAENKKFHGGLNGKRGKPLIHKEVKQKMNLSLTPTAKEILAEAGASCSMSASELVERFIKSKFFMMFLEENNYFGNESK